MKKYKESLKDTPDPIMSSQISKNGMTVKEMMEKLKKSRVHAGQGMYKDADNVVNGMRNTYKS